MNIMKNNILIIISFLGMSCDPFVTEFPDLSNAVMYEAASKTNVENIGNEIKVVTWNIRFGIGRFPFFGDSCGDSVIAENEHIQSIMEKIADYINAMDPDIILLQEVDVESKRTGYMDQVQYLLDNTSMNFGCYASMWKADYIPSDGLGRMDAGNAILSKYELTDAERIQLRLRTDQSGLVQYFYLRRNILKAKVPSLATSNQDFYAVNIHATAFATDDTKQKHIDTYLETLSEIENDGDIFVSGGDLNSVPPGSILDFCESDMCADDDYHTEGADPYHKDGSYFENFEGEPELLQPLYQSYNAAIDSVDANLDIHLTHGPSTSEIKYDRKLDYLFSNVTWLNDESRTHQAAWELSDHMPVSGIINMERTSP